MMKNLTYSNLLVYVLGLVAFVQVAIPSMISIGIALFFLVFVKGLISKELKFKFHIVYLLFSLFYLAYVIGVFYTNNNAIAFQYLEYKLSFLLFPILFSFVPKDPLAYDKIVFGFVLGVVVVIVYGFIHGFFCYLNGGEACFVTTSISPIHHPSYFDAYIIFALFASLIGIINKWKMFRLSWIIPFLLASFIFHALTMSLAAMLFLLLVVAILIMVFVYRKLGTIPLLISIVVIPLLGYFVVTEVPAVEGEWNGAVWYAEKYIDNPNEFVKSRTNDMSGSEQRLVMWTVATLQVMEHPFGVGTGNVDDVLGEKLREIGQIQLAEKKLNPHNQYLQTGIEIGILGVLILLAIIFYGVYFAFKKRNWLLLLILCNLAFNCLFESMLQRQSGIVFYTFWICLLVASEIVPSKISESNED
tara:strand:- start:13780 stop:15027 length:1248 start_codon:yes stop_codon:yes gene_type:complete